MSKDIRSFFVRKDGGSNNKQSDSTSTKKRTLRVIESDSDDDDSFSIIKKPAQKKPKESKSEKPAKADKSPSQKKQEKTKESPVNISSYFGTSPIQQKQQQVKKTEKTPTNESGSRSEGKSKKSKKKSKEKSEPQPDESFTIDTDDGFDETLLQINENELERLAECKYTPSKGETEKKSVKNSPVEEVKKTPAKNGDNPIKTVKTPGSAESKRASSSLLDSGQKRRNIESYQKFLNRGGPKNPGSKEIPKSTPTCLQGITFVISGVLDSLEREEAVQLIQKCGGRVTSTVSKKTNFIVLGEDAGQAKLEKANKLGTKKLTEDQLLDLIRSRSVVDDESGSSQDNFIEGTPKKETSKYFPSETKKRTIESDQSPSSGHQSKKFRKMVEIEAPKFDLKPKKSAAPPESNSSSGYDSLADSQKSDCPESSQDAAGSGPSLVGDSLWVDKYKPKTTKQIIGQGGDKSNVKKLIHWLQNWSKNHSHSTGKKSRPAPWQSQDGSAFKAALLSGPPGVGKTTSVHLVCQELGFDVVEFNASDTRSKKLIHEHISELLSTKSIRGLLKGNVESNHVLVMDEVDGMAGNEDRGGIQELIHVIKHAKVPIICMCNDRSHPKMRSLLNYCFELRFCRPRVEQIKGAMMSVCYKENVKISSEALEEIITNANQDIRQVLHNLSLLVARDKMVNTEQAKKDAAKAKKPLNLGPWDVARKVFSASDHSGMALQEKEELFFQDYSLGPLFVQDTYLRVKPYKAKGDKKEVLNLVSKAADAILIGDIVDRTIRSENAWSLLPIQAIFSSVLPGHIMEGHVQGQIQFPVWLGKNSKRNRFDRILQELQTHMRLSISGSKEAVNLDYLHVLRDAITRPLLRSGADGVPETLRFMSEYNLTKDDVESLMELSLWPGGKDVYSSIDSKVKAALTRTYNKEGKAVPFATSANVKKTKRVDNEYGEEEDDGEEEEDADIEDNLELDSMIKKGKAKLKVEETGTSKGKKEKKEKAPPKEGKKEKAPPKERKKK